MEKELYPSVFRRLRGNTHIRSLVNPVWLNHRQFIQPVFVEEGLNTTRPVAFMPNIVVQTNASIESYIEHCLKMGIQKFLLFPVPAKKSEQPTDFSFVCNLISKLKIRYADQIWLSVDICLCSYTTHGHCGILNSAYSRVLNNESVQILSDYALAVSQAGADCIAPSDMMDGRISAIRKKLDSHKLDFIPILAYSAKFSSQWYGPFRDACHSAPSTNSLKDRKSYQLSPGNVDDAIQCALRDAEEGADIVMVKPAAHYMDVIHQVKEKIRKPVAAYHVSGEYAALEYGASIGLVDLSKAHLELWTGLIRSGANMIISYASTCAKEWIDQHEL